jgi:ERF superfamily
MQRSSESIASLAAALAKAQAELVNPEKSQVATIYPEGSGQAGRSFRYAPLSSGLDIVRKTLGEHEIAMVQTTAIDQTTGIVNLTTMLAHSSGEWIASDWPVCAISETATPHRMGAALTYARRYALFTLVGIAGEDDLDAPDLITPTNQTSVAAKSGRGNPPSHRNGQLNASQCAPAESAAVGRNRQLRSAYAAPRPGAEASAQLRQRLLGELDDLGCGDAAATWAQHRLTEKNRLLAADAERVEEAFAARLAAFGTDVGAAPPTAPAAPDSRPRPRQVRCQAALPGLRPATSGRPPRALRAKPGARPQGQRRIHRAVVPRSPSRGAPLRRRTGVVACAFR